VLHASFLPSLRRRDVPRYVAHNGLTRRFPCSSLAVDTLFGNGFPVSADFSRSETVADPEFYRVIPVERADIIVIDSIYYTDGSRPVLLYKAEELIRFGPRRARRRLALQALRGESNATKSRILRGVGLGPGAPQWTDVFSCRGGKPRRLGAKSVVCA
jgi:hypothetical protein